MTFLETVRRSRSYRGYDESREITQKELEDLVELAGLCPSTVNLQPLRYYLIREKEEVEAFLPNTRWAKALPEITLPHPGKHPTAFIVILQDTDISPNLNRFIRDVGIVAQTMILGAVEMGLGGIMIGSFSAEGVKKTLSLPENLVPMLVVALGKPDEKIILTEVGEDGQTGYYRDENDVHYVPKRKKEDLIVTKDKLK